jgi:hypothetical protein
MGYKLAITELWSDRPVAAEIVAIRASSFSFSLGDSLCQIFFAVSQAFVPI